MNSKFLFCLTLLLAIGLLSLSINSCKKSSFGGRRTTPIQFNTPGGFPQPLYDFSQNPLTEEGFELGRKLFHDHHLAKYLDVTCNSCHQQLAAYTTFDHDLGHGTNHQHTTRNVPGIFNMAWQQNFSWDGEQTSLENQILDCLTAPEKMGMTVEEVAARLDTSQEYKTLFADAFGDETMNAERISKAIAQFVVSIVSSNSKYDKVKKGEAQFNDSEAAGYEIFKTHCSSCHAEPMFTDYSYRNIGLPHRDFHDDAGRMLVTGNPQDSLKFKVPSLRNVGLTSYYMHDGRFAGISEVIEHYSSGIVHTPTLDPLLQSDIQLTNLEKFYLNEFLLSLSDSSIVIDPRFE